VSFKPLQKQLKHKRPNNEGKKQRVKIKKKERLTTNVVFGALPKKCWGLGFRAVWLHLALPWLGLPPILLLLLLLLS
jgi:hypothetical protein